MAAPAPDAVNIHVQGVPQFAGAHSSQTANVTFNYQVEQTLREIEGALPELPLDPESRDKAEGLLARLWRAVSNKTIDVATQSAAEALAPILTAAGSGLGQRLLELIRSAP